MAEHYPMVGQAILETFAEFLGDRWTPKAHETWRRAFSVIAANMQQGATVIE
jgi:hemoglobin-like flavoprotein